jgi:hypothetical protein
VSEVVDKYMDFVPESRLLAKVLDGVCHGRCGDEDS